MNNITKLLHKPGFQEVQGWLNLRVLNVLNAWSEVYREHFITNEAIAPALEIGVHHGRLFLGLEAITPEDVECFALDVFDDQERNIDNSGKGNLGVFLSNVNSLARNPSRVVPVQADSFSVNSCRELSHSYSVISIDGGHTREHAGSDLNYANNTIKPGGLIILDDFNNVNWLGVMEGTLDFLNKPDRRIAPFMAGYNKLFLTTITESQKMRIAMEQSISENNPDITIKRLSTLRGHIVRALM